LAAGATTWTAGGSDSATRRLITPGRGDQPGAQASVFAQGSDHPAVLRQPGQRGERQIGVGGEAEGVDQAS
jgi:hypothetical protein